MRSHLLPKALTRPSLRGNRFIQGGQGTRPKTAWDSWYDDKLVTREGEDILARYDGWAIKELGRLKLIWNSWEPETSFADQVVAAQGLPSFGLRKVTCENPPLLRLFFLSLLWRAAATSRVEFRGTELDETDLGRLQRMVRDGHPEPLDFYPTNLLQIASRGPAHNLVPFVRDTTFDAGDGVMHRHNVIRFYFDGLIAHMHRSMESIKGIEAFIVGGGRDLVVQLQLLDDSFQLANLGQLVAEDMILGRTTRLTASSKK